MTDSTEPVKTEVQPIQPVVATVIGGTGDGGAPIPSGTVLATPDHQPNVIVNVVTPIAAILIRFVNVYVGMVVGLLGAAATSNALTAPDFGHLLLKCMGLAVGGSVILLLKDVVTIFARLEQKYPLLTGSV